MTAEMKFFEVKFLVMASLLERTVSSHFIEAIYDKVVTNTAQNP